MKLITTLAFSIVSLGTYLSASSFDCHKASTSIEKTICDNHSLNELDGKMGKLYHKAKTYQHDLPTYQKDWIKNRNSECGANSDCLYKWTENRIINFKNLIDDAKAGKVVNPPKKKHVENGNVYFPEHGILCDKKAGFCADKDGISLGYTKEYLGQSSQDKIMTYIDRDNMQTYSYILSNGIYCDSKSKKCYNNKWKDKVNSKYTNKLFR